MQTGFIGLGNLGTGMVENLLQAGVNLHIYNRTKSKMEPFRDRATIHESVESIAGSADVLISVLSNDEAIKTVCFEDGLFTKMKAGAVHVCLSTISAGTSELLSNKHREHGQHYVTATVIGRPEAVAAKALTVCVSGSDEKQPEVLQLLKQLGGKNIHNLGSDAKTAAIIKICNNFLIVAAIEAMGEAFNLAEAAGAGMQQLYDIITENIFNAPIYKNYGKIIIDQSYKEASFTSELGLKDTRLALSLAEESSVPLPLADVVKDHFIINHNRGRKEYDWTSIVKVLQEQSEKTQG